MSDHELPGKTWRLSEGHDIWEQAKREGKRVVVHHRDEPVTIPSPLQANYVALPERYCPKGRAYIIDPRLTDEIPLEPHWRWSWDRGGVQASAPITARLLEEAFLRAEQYPRRATFTVVDAT